ncbi:MAG: hypothetical protein KZQ64_15520 [gamma proteobacterium symbiont of Bathyaustriella thionipta]|nr:hypothetical protein [gamma proteobacterium symbiont of Bathyaustriella thionipta]MCU7949972.1 hypothetical protein [gamma proteobacterium symbiont of Bathyaustriella thionipta]MCU7954778.1 hypothetical protein [gamma proteobacterium symbiont of Bathyaustriella thionipta]MCU7956550.1 hypothetical protein [gamma proteobacterium symbiont of Bathyaustriella thionipta]MCU7966545.1 hypothetical protein [gamma proteobacterium symbiont of Bathyaustriella thionipta]
MKQIIGLLISVLFFSSACLASDKRTVCPEERPMLCTMDYTPVCGLTKDNHHKTYANACSACANPEVFSHVPGACPARTLSANEVRTLFSGNTYEASIPSRKLTMTVYVDPDGTMRGMQAGHKFTSKWQISERGEICVSYRDKMSCRFVMEENGHYKKYKINEQGEKAVLVIYQSFAPGNIHNY